MAATAACNLSLLCLAAPFHSQITQGVSPKKEELEDVALKVFADETKGIVCYRTDSGEIVCEGIDEGPHFYPPSGANFYMPDTRAASILPLLGEGYYEI